MIAAVHVYQVFIDIQGQNIVTHGASFDKAEADKTFEFFRASGSVPVHLED